MTPTDRPWPHVFSTCTSTPHPPSRRPLHAGMQSLADTSSAQFDCSDCWSLATWPAHATALPTSCRRMLRVIDGACPGAESMRCESLNACSVRGLDSSSGLRPRLTRTLHPNDHQRQDSQRMLRLCACSASAHAGREQGASRQGEHALEFRRDRVAIEELHQAAHEGERHVRQRVA